MKKPQKPHHITSTCFGEPFWNSPTQAQEAEGERLMDSVKEVSDPFSFSVSFEK